MEDQARSVKTYLLPVLFMGILLFHLIDSQFNFLPEPEITEARTVAEKPEFDPSFLDPFPKDYEAYYNDHFNWRNYFVKASSYLNYYTFKKSALPDEVIIGKDGWLFKSGHQLDVYRGKFRYSDDNLRQIANTLLERKAIVEAQGGKYYLAIPPLKHHIYPEFLPDNVQQINAEGCVPQLTEYLAQNTDIVYVDLLPSILEMKQSGDLLLYHKTDHHWTQHSALIASKILLDRLREDFPMIGSINPEDYSVQNHEYDGMLLAQMLGLKKEMKEQYPQLHYKKNYIAKDSLLTYPSPHDFPFPDEYAMAKCTKDTSLPKLFMVRESFGTYLMNFISDNFETSIYIFDNWKHDFNGAILAQEPSDIYIQFIWEGLLFRLLDNPPEDAGW
jgi:hypothetical protein